MPDNFHAVKEAAISDALQRFGVRSLDAVERVGQTLSPAFKPIPHPTVGPGPIQSLKDAWRTSKPLLPATGRGLASWGKTLGHFVGEGAREMVFGSPFEAVKDLQKHYQTTGGNIPRALGRQVKDFYMHPQSGLKMRALSLGLPALELYSAATQAPEHRGENIGGALGGLLASPFTARLGIPGMAIQAPIQQLGRRLGRVFDPNTPTYPTG